MLLHVIGENEWTKYESIRLRDLVGPERTRFSVGSEMRSTYRASSRPCCGVVWQGQNSAWTSFGSPLSAGSRTFHSNASLSPINGDQFDGAPCRMGLGRCTMICWTMGTAIGTEKELSHHSRK